MLVHRAFMSRIVNPSHAPSVPVPGKFGVRMTGGTMHWKLVELYQGCACWPLALKKNRPSFWPSRLFANSAKPLGAEAQGMPCAPMVAWQPLADVPAVQ